MNRTELIMTVLLCIGILIALGGSIYLHRRLEKKYKRSITAQAEQQHKQTPSGPINEVAKLVIPNNLIYQTVSVRIDNDISKQKNHSLLNDGQAVTTVDYSSQELSVCTM